MTSIMKLDSRGVSHGGITVVDGRVTEITVHQSMIHNFLLCPERCRQELLNPPLDNDASGMGTSCHAAIGDQINRVVQGLQGYTRVELGDVAVAHWQEVMRPNVQLSMNLADDEYVRQVRQGVDNWWYGCWQGGELELWHAAAQERHLWKAIEWPMFWPAALTVEGCTVNIGGHTDALRTDMGIDWKFSQRERKEWEAQRWDVQASTYMALYRYLGVCPEPPVFKIVVVPRNRPGDPQVLTVERGEEWDKWLLWQVYQLARFVVTYGMDQPWPTNDQYSRCSPRWCSAWEVCKGSFGIKYPATQEELKQAKVQANG